MLIVLLRKTDEEDVLASVPQERPKLQSERKLTRTLPGVPVEQCSTPLLYTIFEKFSGRFAAFRIRIQNVRRPEIRTF